MIEHKKEGDLHLVIMHSNSICSEWQDHMLNILDTIEGDCDQGAALVLTGVGKSFCNGLNLEKLMALPPEEHKPFGLKMNEIHSRLLVLPCPTVAAMNGHAFAAGAFLALSLDYRLMREDRGWFCISEVDVGVPIPAAMMQMLRGKLSPVTARDAILTGKRYTADEAIAAGIADGKASTDTLLDHAKQLGNDLSGKEPGIFKTLKQTWFGPMAEALISN
ncbi:enoyl-CoA hydratase/isomerase family protein [Candidatus Marimicrobium litorale]|jgi:Delta3-Delta2-enoyl-CoA isomerase|uniref:Enoyl-CoA hydratase/isomerase family protein n=1 Tax=Candidatus Marimicrobium litorale TaxID=2518991 RepID=A0ABT3T494_9GAMM|nr:enoyl-CoA hydratase/isomerase family protein [Candidatus Marimicrobium litorale]MCX2977093.1 enoyl-CoA hydratase/isomerase family protein [Candidatus Marimicrobium litorale]